MRRRPLTNWLRAKARARTRAGAFLDRQIRNTSCPECGYFFSISFLLKATVFSETEKETGGKRIVCPSCQKSLWYNSNGKIKAVVVSPKPAQVKAKPLWLIRCGICVLICQAIRKIRGIPPPPTN